MCESDMTIVSINLTLNILPLLMIKLQRLIARLGEKTHPAPLVEQGSTVIYLHLTLLCHDIDCKLYIFWCIYILCMLAICIIWYACFSTFYL